MGIFSIFIGIAVALFAVLGYGMYRFWKARNTQHELVEDDSEGVVYNPAPLQQFGGAAAFAAPKQNEVEGEKVATEKKKPVQSSAPARQISGIDVDSTDFVPDRVQPEELVALATSRSGDEELADVGDVPSRTNTEEIVERVALRDVTDVSAGTSTYRNYTVDDSANVPEVRVVQTFTSSVERTTAYVSSANTDSGWSSSDSSSSSSDSTSSSSDY